jgi:hypothetical protein
MKNRINIWGQDIQKYGFSISKSGKDPIILRLHIMLILSAKIQDRKTDWR